VAGLGMGGAILACLGLLGIYVGKIYDEIKHRPLYVVQQTRNVGVATGFERAVWPRAADDLDTNRDTAHDAA